MVAQNVQANNNTGGIGLVAYRSRISFLGSTANNAGAHGLYLIGGYVAAPNLQVNNAGANGVFCQGCWLDASNMQANNAGSNGVLARDAAVVNIHNIQANDATSSGLYAFNNAVVNAEGAQFNNSVNSHNVRVLDSSNVSLGSGTQVQRTAVGINATSHCLLVGSSRVSAEGLDCSGSRGEGVTAFRNSHVDISTSTLDSGTNPNVSVSTGAIISAISIPNLNPNRTVNTLSMHGIIFAN